jgi:hypothetical protein
MLQFNEFFVWRLWGVPVAEDKTVEPTEILAFLGIEFDTLAMELRPPNEKLVELKSDGETLSNRNALLMSIFANFPPLPIMLIMSMASSMLEYLTVQNSGSMKSLTTIASHLVL